MNAATLSVVGFFLSLAACSLLPNAQPVDVHRYTLSRPATAKPTDPDGPVILVSRVQTRAGLASRRMMYRRSAHAVAYFSRNQWAAPPAEMLEPLIVDSLEATGRFGAVIQPTTPVAADLRLDLDLLELYQDFSSQPGSVHLSLRAQLLDMHLRRVLATQRFDYSVDVDAADAASGVEALNILLEALLSELAQFCTERASYHAVRGAVRSRNPTAITGSKL